MLIQSCYTYWVCGCRPSGLMDEAQYIVSSIPIFGFWKQSGAAEACWAHNPEVDGSKPSSATVLFFQEESLHHGHDPYVRLYTVTASIFNVSTLL